MKSLSIDLETFSKTDIKSAGAFKYSENVELLLFGYSVDYNPPKCVDVVCGEEIPKHILEALTDPLIIKWAHNAAFERAVLSAYLGIDLPPEQWRCSAVLSAVAGYPLSLDESSKALGTAEKKDSEGKALITYFCMPCKPTKTNGGRTRNMPWHAPEKWLKFIAYCCQDIVTEQAISTALSWVQISSAEQALWCLDQRINERGWKVDIDLAECALVLDKAFRERLLVEAKRITGLENPNSIVQIKNWIEKEEGIVLEGVTAEIVSNLLKTVKSFKSRRFLEIRQEMSKTSIKKYTAILNAVGKGSRVRGLFQFYGAGRTGRWAGRLVQVQNLPRISDDMAPVLMLARELVKERDAEMIEMCFGSLSMVLSQLIRTAFIAEDGKRLIISDFSAIEAKILAWIADEEWVLQVFREKKDLYKATASKMFGTPIELVGKEERQKGKISVLLLGYQGGVPALIKMGALDKGLKEEELPEIVSMFREANPNTVKFWYASQRAAITAIETGERVEVGNKGIFFSMRNGTLLLTLPSGRSLYYPKATVEEAWLPAKFEKRETGRVVGFYGPGKDMILYEEVCVREKKLIKVIRFWAVNSETKKWEKSATYGGKLVENMCQAISRDCLANAMLNLESIGVKICSHVHDEVIAEMPLRITSVEEINRMMVKPLPWMKGLPLGAEGDESLYYNK